MVVITIKPDINHYMFCDLCGKFFKHIHYDKRDGYDIVHVSVNCKVCRALLERKWKLKRKLIDLEYQIFCREK